MMKWIKIKPFSNRSLIPGKEILEKRSNMKNEKAKSDL